jgi:cytochrome c-type biogenesis protein CcmH/NrfF
MFKRLAQILSLCVITVVMLGANDNSTTRLDRIGHKLVCQCGCGQILMECNHVGCPVSGPMIEDLKKLVDAGKPESAILDIYIAKYGPIVLAAPIRGGFDNVAWIVPYATFIMATLGVALLVRYWHRRHMHVQIAAEPVAPEPPSNDMQDRIRRDTTYED